MGDRVGYKVRFQERSSTSTQVGWPAGGALALPSQILYQTDGMLLREAMVDPHLTRYLAMLLGSTEQPVRSCAQVQLDRARRGS